MERKGSREVIPSHLLRRCIESVSTSVKRRNTVETLLQTYILRATFEGKEEIQVAKKMMGALIYEAEGKEMMWASLS